MKLMRLKLHNFKSYADCELDLSGVSACSIIGGNGAGKSTIAEAIIWAIYGSAKLGNKDLIRDDADSDYTYVVLDIEIEGKTYEIRREYDDGKMGLSLRVDNKPVAQGSKNLAAILVKAIGASKEILQESVVIPQGQLDSFIKATPAQRRDLVASILGLDKYGKAWETAKDSLKEMTVAVGSRSGTIAAIEGQIEGMPTHESLDKELTAQQEMMVELNGKMDVLTKKRERILAEDKLAREAQVSLSATVKEITNRVATTELQFDVQIGKIEADVRMCDKRVGDMISLTSILPSLESQLQEANLAVEEMVKASQEIELCNRAIEERRKKVGVIKSGAESCPLCGTKIDPNTWQIIISNIEDEMRELMTRISAVKKPVIEKRPETIAGHVSATKEAIAKLEGQHDSKQILVDQLANLKSQKEQIVTQQRAELEVATQTLKAIGAQINNEANVIQNEVVLLGGVRDRLSTKLIQLSATKQSRETLENALKDAQTNLALFKTKLPETEFVVAALSPTGIPLMITDYYMPMIAQRTQDLLHMMSDGQLNVKIEVTEVGTKKGIELLVGTDTFRPIESLSGGEGTRVSLALRIALSQILQEMSGCHFNCLIIDEPEYLDPAGVSQFVATVNTLRDQYQQIFAISHIEGIRDSFPNAIMVTKVNKVSNATVI